ncbi:hypothetical protein J7T55_000106 [Diaporthe amygdali]|uniref:uncharacterized protein n=1 Tax=Phomopsis amygdali TaxID=1214568 RepID=UPI0022FE564A|nr:uncharacterized protein J7T55_000106 [Diaporthe amygdali]KAJ0100736.1 hypothetical protein J7T55_000106 [Diaporthe amygdali]
MRSSLSFKLLLILTWSDRVISSLRDASQQVVIAPPENVNDAAVASSDFHHEHIVDDTMLAALKAYPDPVDAMISLQPEMAAQLAESRLIHSTWLVPGGCEQVRVGTMSPAEASALLLRHLRMDFQPVAEDMRRRCEEVADKLGYLALAVELAGAYIGNDATPTQALLQYIEDYDRHRDELLRMDNFRGLLPTQKTVWTVWQTTLDKIRAEHADLQPGLLLTFLAQFRGTIVQDEMLRLASLGMAAVDAEVGDRPDDGIPSGLRQFLPCDRGEWVSFRYRRARDILHGAVAGDAGRCGSTVAVVVYDDYSGRVLSDDRRAQAGLPATPDYAPPGKWGGFWDGAKTLKEHECLFGTILGRVYYGEGLWKEAESLFVQVMETLKRVLGEEHPDTLTSMSNLASTYGNQGRWSEAESLVVQSTLLAMNAWQIDTDSENQEVEN